VGSSRVRPRSTPRRIDGYPAMVADSDAVAAAPDTTTEEYFRDQVDANARITRDYVEPVARRTQSRAILDVGCGVGRSVASLLEDGYDAYGVDLPGLTRFWSLLDCPRDRFLVVDPDDFILPFDDDAFDLAFSFGVLEHVGTSDGHATRRPDYHAWRRRWLREIFRAVRPGGHLLMGGPNRSFPLDFSHGLDSRAGWVERWLSQAAGKSIHRTWGEYFLWGYPDFDCYLASLPFEIEALSIRGLLQYGRVPAPLRPLARFYVDHLPRRLLDTGFNPWVMALIKKTAAPPAPGPGSVP